MKAQILMKST